MTFLHPQYFHALWLVPLLVLLRLWSARRAGAAADSFVAKRLRELLLAGASSVHLWTVFSLQVLALAGFIAALAQPRWGEEKRQIAETGKSVIIAIDTSRSMLADDVTPNRLLRAKLAAEDILTTLQSHRVGLIAFAGRAYLQAPLTTDHEAVIESIQALDTNTIPRGGTTISEAIREAIEAFGKTKAHSHGLILFSDGGDEDPELDGMLQKAREQKIAVVAIGVGTDVGSMIPDPDPDHAGDFIRDPATGNPVHSRLEEATLQKMAKETNGRYLKLGAQALNASVVGQVLSTLDSMESGAREEVKPIERFYWPLSFAMLCLMLALLLRPRMTLPRFSPAMASVVLLLALPVSARASIFGGSTDSTAEEAQEAYKAHDYMHARDLYARLLSEDTSPGARQSLAYGLGAASHQLKDYDRAIDSFSTALESSDPSLQARAHQGLGTTLYDQGTKSLQQQPEMTQKAWEDSLQHFDSALKLKDDRNLRENRDFVQQQLVELKKQLEQQKQQQQQKGKGKKDKGEKGKDKGQKDEDGDQEGDDPKDGKKGDKDNPKDGQQKGDQEKKGGDSKEGDPKDGSQKDGKPGDQQQAQETGEPNDKEGQRGEKPLEGKIQAGEAGKEAKQQQLAEAEKEAAAEEKKQDQTGFSRNEARNLLRTYNDQMLLQPSPRRERTIAKDW